MNPIERILCPTDFSDAALHAFQFAERLATSMSAEIILLHVFDQPASLTVADQSKPADPAVIRHLDEVPTRLPPTSIQRVLHAGDPAEVICWMAQDRKCDLIVMGTHGRRGLRHLLLGSVAEYVMRHARCPLMTVRLIPEGEQLPTEPMQLPLPAPRFM